MFTERCPGSTLGRSRLTPLGQVSMVTPALQVRTQHLRQLGRCSQLRAGEWQSCDLHRARGLKDNFQCRVWPNADWKLVPWPVPAVYAAVLNKCSWTYLLEGRAHVYFVPAQPAASLRGRDPLEGWLKGQKLQGSEPRVHVPTVPLTCTLIWA